MIKITLTILDSITEEKKGANLIRSFLSCSSINSVNEALSSVVLFAKYLSNVRLLEKSKTNFKISYEFIQNSSQYDNYFRT